MKGGTYLLKDTVDGTWLVSVLVDRSARVEYGEVSKKQGKLFSKCQETDLKVSVVGAY